MAKNIWGSEGALKLRVCRDQKIFRLLFSCRLEKCLAPHVALPALQNYSHPSFPPEVQPERPGTTRGTVKDVSEAAHWLNGEDRVLARIRPTRARTHAGFRVRKLK